MDTPYPSSRTLLGRRLNDLVLTTMSEVDVVVLCLLQTRRSAPVTFIAERLLELRRQKLVVAVTKSDGSART